MRKIYEMVSFPDNLQHIISQEYPRFTDTEYLRRRKTFEQKMIANGVSHVLVRGFLRIGAAIPYFTGW